ncbi:MAG: peptidoglycan-binding domain-containing protein [Paracoccaceae bacterium]|nr:peptidoglycan-binding domain-containing protein [Paracoccaceae bacterium]
MLPNVKMTTRAVLASLIIASTAALPAHALGKNERNFLKGAAAAVLITTIINQSRANAAPRYAAPRAQTPQYFAPQYAAPQQYAAPRPVQPRPVYGNVVGGGYGASLYQTPAAQAFNRYSPTERRAIQRTLAQQGYYRSGIDGSFGPGTYSAVSAYARDAGVSDRLESREGAFGVFDGLIY